MANVGKYFLSGLEKSYSQAAQSSEEEERAKNALEREKALTDYKNKIESEEEQKQNELIRPLLTNKIFGLTAGHFPVERDITPRERTSRLLQLNEKGISKYKNLKEISGDVEGYDRISELLGLKDKEVTKDISPEDQDRINRTIVAGKLMGVKPEKTFEQVDKIIHPKISKTVEQPYKRVIQYSNGKIEEQPIEGGGLNPAYKPTWRESDIEDGLYKDKKGNWFQKRGLLDPNANIWATDKKGKVRVVNTVRKKILGKGTNGEVIYDPDFQKDINKDFQSIQDAESQLQYGYKTGKNIITGQDEKTGKNIYSKDIFGNYNKNVTFTTAEGETIETTTNDLATYLQQQKELALNKIYKTSTSNFRDKWDKITKREKEEGGIGEAKELWVAFHEMFRKKELSFRDMQAMVNMIRVRYGIPDPLRQLGAIGDIETLNQMKKELMSDSENEVENTDEE